MSLLRPYHFLSALLAFSLVLTVTMPLAQHACAMMDAMTAVPEMPPCHGEDSTSDEEPPPMQAARMPCCVLVAVGAPLPVPPTLEGVAPLALPSFTLASQTTRGVAHPTTSPPGRPTPLHIALGRFLT